MKKATPLVLGTLVLPPVNPDKLQRVIDGTAAANARARKASKTQKTVFPLNKVKLSDRASR